MERSSIERGEGQLRVGATESVLDALLYRNVLEHLTARISTTLHLCAVLVVELGALEPSPSQKQSNAMVVSLEACPDYCRAVQTLEQTSEGVACSAFWRSVCAERGSQWELGRDHAVVHQCPSGLNWVDAAIGNRGWGRFYGVLLGGPFRPTMAEAEMVHAIRQTALLDAGTVPLRSLVRQYDAVAAISEAQRELLISECTSTASSLARVFDVVLAGRAEREEDVKRERMLAGIGKILLEALVAGSVAKRLPDIVRSLHDWSGAKWIGLVELTVKDAPDPKSRVRYIAGTPPMELRREGEGGTVLMPALAKAGREPQRLSTVWIEAEPPREAQLGSVEWIPIPLLDSGLYGAVLLPCDDPAAEEEQTWDSGVRSVCRHVATSISLALSLEAAVEREARVREDLQGALRQQQEAAERLRTSLLGLSHTLRRPLFMIRSYVSLLLGEREALDRRDLRSELQLVDTVLEHAELLSAGVSRAFALEAMGSRTETPLADVDIAHEVRGLCAGLELTTAGARGKFRFQGLDIAPKVRFDRQAFLFAVYSLLDNALKYSDPGTRIAISYKDEEGAPVLSITSIGEPILDPNLPFTMFWRGRSAARTDEAGIGLGCWAAREIVQSASGRVDLKVDGKESEFRIIFPRRSEVQRA